MRAGRSSAREGEEADEDQRAAEHDEGCGQIGSDEMLAQTDGCRVLAVEPDIDRLADLKLLCGRQLCGVRLALRVLHSMHEHTMFSHEVGPPRSRGIT